MTKHTILPVSPLLSILPKYIKSLSIKFKNSIIYCKYTQPLIVYVDVDNLLI
jgi:hypothetical protein